MNIEFIHAIKKNNYVKIETMLNNPSFDPVINNYGIRKASKEGYIEIVKVLLSNPKVDPSVNNNEAIQMASNNGHVEIIKLLLNDPRVDWRYVSIVYLKPIIKQHESILKHKLSIMYLTIKHSSPQINIGTKESSKIKSQIPKEIIKRIVYLGIYNEFRNTINNIPSINLIALANILNISYLCYGYDSMDWNKLCYWVKERIYNI